MERDRLLLSRRKFVIGAAAALGATLTSCNNNQAPESRTASEALASYYWRSFLARFSHSTSQLSPLEEILKTDSGSDKIGLVNENIIEEDERQGSMGNSIVAFNPLAPTTWIPNGGQRITVFANSLDYGHFRQSRGTVLRVFDRTMAALHSGKKVYVVLSILNVEDSELAEATKLLLSHGVTNFIIGNEPNVEDQGKAEGNNPKKVLRAARIVRKEADNLGIAVELSPPGLAHFGSGEYWDDLVAEAGSNYPFVGVNDHYYDSAKNYADRVWIMRRKMELLGLKGPYRVTEEGNPSELYKSLIPPDELAKGGVILKLLVGASLATVDEQFWYCALDWGKPEHSLMREENKKLVPNDSYIAYRVGGKLANGITKSEIDFSGGKLAVHAQRKDGINFSVIGSITEDRVIDFKLEPGDLVFNTKGELTKEKGILRLNPPTWPGCNGEEWVIIHNQ